MFFAFTGFAIIFYTNPRPFEPRERDYAIVGSFYIFAIWIGFGVLALYDYLKSFGPQKTIAIAVTVISFLAVPSIMAFENWDDHDRSNRYTTHLNAQAYLESCDPNAILFTIGDNDTFPLWYMQEVEGIRTDVKLVNTSLFQTDWYIDQMKRATYDAPPIPSQLTHDEYKYGTLDVAYYFQELFPKLKDSVIDLDTYMKWIRSDSKKTFYDLDEDGNPEKMLPTNKIRIPVNKENVLKYGIVAQKDADKIVPYIDITVGRALAKNTILMLDILNNFNWERPIYFTGGSNTDSEYIWLKDYLQLDFDKLSNIQREDPIMVYLAQFNAIDKFFDKILQQDGFLPYNEKIKRIASSNYYISWFINLHKYQLRYFGELRNHITHGIKLDGNTYALPSQYAIDKIARFKNSNISAGFSVNDKTFTKKKKEEEEEEEDKEETRDFYKIPWNLNVNYTQNLNMGTTLQSEKTSTQTLGFSGNIKVTPKWKLGFHSGYDFSDETNQEWWKKFSYTSIDIYRDLHCWELLFHWIPTGYQRSYTLTIRVKADILKDLKYEKRKDWIAPEFN